MKRLRLLFLLALFAGFVLVGLSAGRQFGVYAIKGRRPVISSAEKPKVETKSLTNQLSLNEIPAATTPPISESDIATPESRSIEPAPAATPMEPPQQNNILLIGVDDLQAKSPRLEGVWLVLYLSGSPHFFLMPIYPGIPAEDGKVTSQDGALVKSFRSDPKGSLGPNFTAEMQKRQLWWSGYILFDRQALTEIIDGVNAVQGGAPGEALRVSDVPSAWKNPQSAKQRQAHLAQALCQATASLTVDDIDELDSLFLLFSQHVLSDMSREQVAADLVGLLAQGEGITCEFPSMAENTSAP